MQVIGATSQNRAILQGRYDIYQVIADMLSIMIDNTTKKSNLSTILISIKTSVCNKMFVTKCSLFGPHYVNTGGLIARPR